MKTLNEAIIKIKELSKKFDEVCKEIDVIREKSLNTVIDKNTLIGKAKRNPIKGHPLSNYDLYVQKLYFTLLASIIQVEKDDSDVFENRYLYILRLIEGVNPDIDSDTIMKNSLELNEEIIEEFTESIINNKLYFVFVVDSLVVSLLNGSCSDQLLEYLSLLFEMINVPKDEIVELTELAVIIIEKNSKNYIDFSSRDLKIKIEYFFFYILDFYEGILSNNSRLFHLEYKQRKPLNEDKAYLSIEEFNSKKIVIKNIEFVETEYIPEFLNNEDILIENCGFERIKDDLTFTQCKNIIITKVNFKSINSNFMSFVTCSDILLTHSNFEACQGEKEENKDISLGGLMFFKSTKKLKIDTCRFENCSNSIAAIACLQNVGNFLLRHSEFINCNSFLVWYRLKNYVKYQSINTLFLLDNSISSGVINCLRQNSGEYIIENKK